MHPSCGHRRRFRIDANPQAMVVKKKHKDDETYRMTGITAYDNGDGTITELGASASIVRDHG